MSKTVDLSALRREYSSQGLHETDLSADPTAQLQRWLHEAVAAEVMDATSMCLSTVSADGAPSSRIVLLKNLDARGLTFFTRYNSRKGHDIALHPAVSLVFHWREFNRQVRIEGSASKTTREESREYFQTRPRKSRIAARVACAHESVADRATLERLFAEEDRRFPDDAVPLPDEWGGYLVTPTEFEFWQGRENRLHDRIVYQPGATPGSWRMSRLLP
ncbi:MAG TPA: pyridoxamine 5'-phosphate oxidase [Polyangiaceae bacterium]|nr:pyridoxamine 5'-phosphate oxidase [Polyangiaceae bacterium]